MSDLEMRRPGEGTLLLTITWTVMIACFLLQLFLELLKLPRRAQ